MQVLKNHVLNRDQKKSILIDAFYASSNPKQPIIIFCHGYKGFKDWGAWNVMAKKIAELGYCFIKFNFSHNGGAIENPIDFPDLEAFGQNNYTKELDDLNDVITWSQNYFRDKPFVDTQNICLIGHSRGGGICILKASEDKRITKLITLASVSDFENRTATIGNLKEWKEKGIKYVLNGRTKQQMPHYYQFYEDFIANKHRLNIEAASKKLNIPQLIIHGNNDTSILVKEAEALHEWNPKSTLQIIENANHVFNTKHPWESNELSPELQLVVQETQAFLSNF